MANPPRPPRRRKKIPRGRRETVYVRDKWTCQSCGLRFDPTVRWVDKPGYAPYIKVPDPRSWIALEIDHIHPLHHGGSNEPDNLRAACSTCNASKGAKTEGNA